MEPKTASQKAYDFIENTGVFTDPAKAANKPEEWTQKSVKAVTQVFEQIEELNQHIGHLNDVIASGKDAVKVAGNLKAITDSPNAKMWVQYRNEVMGGGPTSVETSMLAQLVLVMEILTEKLLKKQIYELLAEKDNEKTADVPAPDKRGSKPDDVGRKGQPDNPGA